MKRYVLYGSIISVACLVTLFVFLDFRKHWKASESFQSLVRNAPLSVRHLYIAPEQLQVRNWQVGEFADYHLQTNTTSRLLSFHVAAQDSKTGNRFWLRTEGFTEFNKTKIELWRLLDETNLRPGSEQWGFLFPQGAIPLPFAPVTFLSNPIVFEELENQVIETSIGNLECRHYFVYVRSQGKELVPLLELWTNPTVRPLGIVRARWRGVSLDLVQTGINPSMKIPESLQKDLNRTTPIDGTCIRCHTKEIGGNNLISESIRWISGEALNLTEVLLHYQQAGIVKIEDPIQIHFTGYSRRSRQKAFVRFSWEKGSFWIKPNNNGQIVVFFDEIANQGNIVIQPHKGRLAVDLQH